MKIARFAPHFSNPDDIIRKFCAKNFKRPFSVEMVYLPFVLFKYYVEASRFFGEKKIWEGRFLADMVQGVPMNIRKGTGLKVGAALERDFAAVRLSENEAAKKRTETIAIEAVEASESQVLPVILVEAEAIARGKKLLRYDLMRLIGGLRYRKVEIILYPETKLVYYPYWLVYYRGRRGEMKFAVIDGVDGRKESEEIVQSIKMGLVKKKQAPQTLEFSEGANPN
jgi:hypothetical protein